MKKIFDWQVILGIVLMALSAAVYYIHYLIFRDAHHIFLYLIGDIAFLFVEVLIVTLILHRLLTSREKRSMMKKMNMVIGAFFSEAGTELIKLCRAFDSVPCGIAKELSVNGQWSDKDFVRMRRKAGSYACAIECGRGDISALKDLLLKKRDFVLRLLENPNLLEHESFTNLLWAVSHLTEELAYRKDLKDLPQKDYEHIAGDIKRAYTLLISEWLFYIKHLKSDYPYLFSLAIRTNPFDPSASVVIR
jgi:hypothetical protein